MHSSRVHTARSSSRPGGMREQQYILPKSLKEALWNREKNVAFWGEGGGGILKSANALDLYFDVFLTWEGTIQCAKYLAVLFIAKSLIKQEICLFLLNICLF